MSKATAKAKPKLRWLPSWITIAYLFPFALLLLLSNLAGEGSPEMLSDDKYGPHFGGDGELMHGWPLKCLHREWTEIDPQSQWRFWEGTFSFDSPAAFINVGLALCLLGAGGVSLELVRGRRTRLNGWRVGLSDLLMATTIVGVFCGIYAWQRQEFQRELTLLQKIESTRENADWSDWHSGQLRPKSRLHSFLQLRFFDSVRSLYVSGDEIQYAVQFPNVTVLSIHSVSNSQFAQLQEMDSLVAIDMTMAGPTDESNEPGKRSAFRLPPLPNLKGLNLYDSEFCGDGLENVPALERLDACCTQLDDGDVETLCKLKRLRRLTLWGTNISDEGVAKLRVALPECEID